MSNESNHTRTALVGLVALGLFAGCSSSEGTSSSGGTSSGGPSNTAGTSSSTSSSGAPTLPTNITIVGDATNGITKSTVTSVTCNPGKNVTFPFPSGSKYGTGAAVDLVSSSGSSSSRIAVEGYGGILYWAASAAQAFPQTGSATIAALVLESENGSIAPGTVTISGTYNCD